MSKLEQELYLIFEKEIEKCNHDIELCGEELEEMKNRLKTMKHIFNMSQTLAMRIARKYEVKLKNLANELQNDC